MIAVGSGVYFSDGSLWKSDGTAAGTFMLDSNGYVTDLTDVNGTIFFVALGSLGYELWSSDGTPSGTHLVKNMRPGWDGDYFYSFTAVGTTLFFVTDDRELNGFIYDLWKSDGTAAGTTLITTFDSGPDRLANANGKLLFNVSTPENGAELWQSDSTAAGTRLLKDLAIGHGDSQPRPFVNSQPQKFVDINGTVFFVASDPATGAELWKSDGTLAGTQLVKDVAPGPGDSYLTSLTNVNGTLFFAAGGSLWKSNGTTAGTQALRDVGTNGFALDPSQLTAVGNTLFFLGSNGDYRALWKSDGTAAGTVVVKTFNYAFGPTNLVAANGTLFFTTDDGVHGVELWKSDGTIAGTALVKDIDPGTPGSNPSRLTPLNNTVFFIATVAGHIQLWKSDGNDTGTVLVKDPFPNTDPPYIDRMVAADAQIFFSVYNPDNTCALWRSDGTTEGTIQIKGIAADGLTPVHNMLFFTVADDTGGRALWRSNGTTTGTILVKRFALPETMSYALSAVPQRGAVLFNASSSNTGLELWQSNGTPEGTTLLQDIASGAGSSSPVGFTVSGSQIFFAADDNTSGCELWSMPLSAVSSAGPSISGPDQGVVQLGHSFQASVEALAPTLPVTYTWQATDQITVVHSNNLTDSVVFTWATPGEKVITVTASAATGIIGSATQTITLHKGTHALIGAGGGSLSYTDEQGHITSVQVPAGAVLSPLDLRYVDAVAQPLPNAQTFAGLGFYLDAYRDNIWLDGFSFTTPIKITLSYQDTDVAYTSENTLRLFYWNGSDWLDAATTCSPPSTYERDPIANQISVDVCHLTAFALGGNSAQQQQIFLPLMRR